MKLAFVKDNMIMNDDQIFFKKDNVISLITNYVYDEKNDDILIMKCIKDPEFLQSSELEIGLICELVDKLARTPENIKLCNIKI
jgi:hypothetical protein